jgi:hypothetical protein
MQTYDSCPTTAVNEFRYSDYLHEPMTFQAGCTPIVRNSLQTRLSCSLGYYCNVVTTSSSAGCVDQDQAVPDSVMCHLSIFAVLVFRVGPPTIRPHMKEDSRRRVASTAKCSSSGSSARTLDTCCRAGYVKTRL